MANFWDPYRRWFLIDNDLVLPTVEDLDAFQQTSGFRLPDAYRDLALCFGLGSFEVPVEIAFAIPDQGTDWLFPTETFRPDYIKLRDQAQVAAQGGADPSAACYARLIFFGVHGNGGYYAWDPADITDPATGDARIYRVDDQEDTSLPYQERLEDFGASFTEFVLGHVWADEFRGVDPAVEAPLARSGPGSGYPRIFRPERS